jgi:hypothetical protein
MGEDLYCVCIDRFRVLYNMYYTAGIKFDNMIPHRFHQLRV